MSDLFDNHDIRPAVAGDDGSSLPRESVSGEIIRVVYVSDDETYTVLRVQDEKGRIHTVVGQLGGAFEGQGITAWGKWEKHHDYGEQFTASRFKFSLPVSTAGIEKYLASGLIYGIGPKRAKMIVAQFKEKTLEILDNFSARLLEIPGFGAKTLESIRTAWKEHSEKREVILYFQSLGISLTFCQKIYKIFGNEALKIVRTDPYMLAERITGIGFAKADVIARNMGISHNDEKRLSAGVRYALGQLSQLGHVCYPEEEFLKYNAELLEISEEDSRRSLLLACTKKMIVIDEVSSGDVKGRFVYDSGLYHSETELVKILKAIAACPQHFGRRLSSAGKPSVSVSAQPQTGENLRGSQKSGASGETAAHDNSAARRNRVELNADQLSAIDNIVKSPITIITGGPGVGKTTLVGEIVRRALSVNLKISLAAPTGRAAKRLSESTGFPASTIHRLLKWDPVEKNFVHNQKNRLDCDILIADEVSMLDLPLAFSLFRAIKPSASVVLVGDADQLPSVGPGNILNDMIRSGLYPVARLVRIYRQDSRSRIIPNAYAVNSGRMIDLSSGPKGSLSDFYWIEQDNASSASDMIVRMAAERIPARFKLNPLKDVQVLSPMTRGDCGTIALNEKIQSVLNSGHNPSIELAGKRFKQGDKVIQTSNNYDKNIFNGDIGFVHGIDAENRSFSVNFDGQVVTYDFSEADQLNLAYAITIHKSQGSEFQAVVVPCLTAHYIMLQRNLLYTAITRAKKLLVLIGSKKALHIAISNCRIEPRFSGFLHRMTGERVNG